MKKLLAAGAVILGSLFIAPQVQAAQPQCEGDVCQQEVHFPITRAVVRGTVKSTRWITHKALTPPHVCTPPYCYVYPTRRTVPLYRYGIHKTRVKVVVRRQVR